MSCRSTYGGRATSACATAISHGNSADVSRVIHKLKREAQEQGYYYSPSVEDMELLFHSYKNIISSDSQISDRRKQRVFASIENALQKIRSGEEDLPNPETFYAWTNAPSTLETETIMSRNRTSDTDNTGNATTLNPRNSSPKPYHKTFHNFHKKTLRATDSLFKKRPSTLTLDEAQEVFEEWISQVSQNYNIPTPQFYWNEDALDAGGGFYTPSTQTIEMSHISVTTLLHEYRHHMQANGVSMVHEDIEEDARAWSLSLYYKTRPNLFKRLVSERKILHISPQEL